MELSDTLRTLLRRWYIVLLGLLLTAGLGWGVYRAVPATHEATASILLMPSDVMVGDAGNPYLYLGGMRDVLDVLVRRSDSEQIHEATLAAFEGSDYRVEPDATTQSPIVVITVQSPSPEDAIALLQTVMATVDSTLVTMQDELALPPTNRIQLRELVVDTTASVDTGTGRQAAIVAVGAGLLGTLLLTGTVDRIIVRRRARHSMTESDAPATPAPVTEDDSSPVALPADQQQSAGPDDPPRSPGSPVAVGGIGRAPGRHAPADR